MWGIFLGHNKRQLASYKRRVVAWLAVRPFYDNHLYFFYNSAKKSPFKAATFGDNSDWANLDG